MRLIINEKKKLRATLGDLNNDLLNTCLKRTPTDNKMAKLDITISKNSLPCMKKACKADLENINTIWNSSYYILYKDFVKVTFTQFGKKVIC